MPFHLHNELHVISALGMNQCTKEEMEKMLPVPILSAMASKFVVKDNRENDLLCDESPLQDIQPNYDHHLPDKFEIAYPPDPHIDDQI